MKLLISALALPFLLFSETVISTRSTRIYALNGTVVKEIPKDTKLEVEDFERDKKFLKITKNGHLINKADTYSFEQYLTFNEKEKLDLEASFKTYQRDLQRVNTELKRSKFKSLKQNETQLYLIAIIHSAAMGGRVIYSYSRLLSKN